MPNQMQAPEPEETTEAPEASAEVEAPEETQAEETAWSGVSQEEWNQLQENQKVLVQAVREMYGRGGEQQAPVEEELDEEDMDLGQMIQHYVDQRFQEVSPVIEAQQAKMGQEALDNIYTQAEEQLGEFDRKLAERISQSEFAGLGIPVTDPRAHQAAQWAAFEGAKMAAQIRLQERQAGAEEYKKSVSRDTFDDGQAGTGGVRAAKDADSMEEVIARWAGQSEV